MRHSLYKRGAQPHCLRRSRLKFFAELFFKKAGAQPAKVFCRAFFKKAGAQPNKVFWLTFFSKKVRGFFEKMAGKGSSV
ncbi:hypothetical protein [Anaerotruncus colihominis]|uniref:hypothetical protein n=1 Tax=Anaerotruncus colihominis TaxID=169435 RepID=UPI0015F34798|nr:hypothetical protein [Anaerotruncus colihominis]